MKKILSPLLILLFLLFSMYYTNKTISILKDNDPIMKEIKLTKEKYIIKPINAQIIGNNIISGKSGKEIDYEESYNKMKRYGIYNESLTSLKKTKPVISIEDNYDKYLIGGNRNNRNISLVFKIEKNTNIKKILNILKNNNINATFFIDGTYLENNIKLIKSISNHELEILSYNNSYNSSLFNTSISYLNSVTGKKVKYCYTEKDNIDLLKLCIKNKLHTIKPTIIINKDLLKIVKNNISNSIIITIEINNSNLNELTTTIKYIKSHGYNLVTLDELLKE